MLAQGELATRDPQQQQNIGRSHIPARPDEYRRIAIESEVRELAGLCELLFGVCVRALFEDRVELLGIGGKVQVEERLAVIRPIRRSDSPLGSLKTTVL